MAAKRRPYHHLIERAEDGTWSLQFGDFSRAVVVQERRDVIEAYPFPKAKNLRVITTGQTQAEAVAAVAALNAAGASA